MDFKTFRNSCKYNKLGYDEDHQVIDTCRHKDSFSEGCSWGMCHEVVCPILTAQLKKPMNRGDAIRQLDNKGLALLLAQMMDVAALKTIKVAGLQDVELFETFGRMERNIENMLEFLNGPVEEV